MIDEEEKKIDDAFGLVGSRKSIQSRRLDKVQYYYRRFWKMEDVISFLATIYSSLTSAPLYHIALEVGLVVAIIWLIFHKSYRPSDVTKLTEKEKDELIAEWQPEPLVPDTPQDHPALHPLYVEGKMKKYVQIEGKEYLNVATLNFLDLVGDERIEASATKALYKYGVGSCGPRGFYGTVDVHLDLEKRLAQFMHCEEAVLYSYGFPTIASAIPAYAKRGDVVFCDNGVNFAIQKGLEASRARVEFFNHNDVEDLERLLKLQQEKDKQNPKKAKVTRRFLVVEGIYINYGDICPLPKLMELKWKYSVRIFIDESVSLGVLGASGRGLTEHFNVDVEDVDMICASLENAIATTGGFCAGRSFVVDHQRLSGLGYCFSASLPPLLAAAAIEAFDIIEQEPGRLRSLRSNSIHMLAGLRTLRHFVLSGVEGSPVFHLRIRHPELHSHPPAVMLDKVVRLAREKGVILTRAAYLPEQELHTPEPSIRIAVNQSLTTEEIDKVVNAIQVVSETLF